MHDEFQAKTFELLSAQEQLGELKLMIATLDVGSKVCFDHAGNYWRDRKGNLLFSQSYEGYQFPQEKEKVLTLIEEGLRSRNRRPNFRSL